MGSAVTDIATLGDRAVAVLTAAGERHEAEIVCHCGDRVHAFSGLLGSNPAARRAGQRAASRPPGFSLVSIGFGLRGNWPGIAEQTWLMPPDLADLAKAVCVHGVVPGETMIILDHPSHGDPLVAPEGCSAFRAVVPVPNLKRFPAEWEGDLADRFAARILDEIERRLIPGLSERLMVQSVTTPSAYARAFNLFGGSPFGALRNARLSPAFTDVRGKPFRNLYLAGSAVAPGLGVPGALASAKLAAAAVLDDLR